MGGDVGFADRFVWQEGGPETYRAVIGTHIEAPHWWVRYARFEGDVAERAEERIVYVDAEGKVVRIQHALPEGRAGEALSLEEARRLATDTIRSTLGLDPSALREVSAEPSERPFRRDWAFVFEDPAVGVGGDGEARLAVSIAGDEVVDVLRHVHVPEDWQRAEQQRFALTSLIGNVCTFPVGAGLLAGAVAGLVGWSRGRFARRTFGVAFLGLFVVFALRALNAWPAVSASFDTSQPWVSQALMAVAGSLVGAGFQAALLALIFGFAHRWQPAGSTTPRTTTLVRGVALGAAWAGLAAAAGAAAASTGPVWGNLGSAGSAFPWIGTALDSVAGWAMGTALLLLLFGLASWLSGCWKRRHGATIALLLAAGLLLVGVGGIETIPRWLASGLGTGVVLGLSYWLVLRFQPALVPLAAASMAALGLIRQVVLAPYPGASVAALLAVASLGVVGVWWAGRLETDSGAGTEPQ